MVHAVLLVWMEPNIKDVRKQNQNQPKVVSLVSKINLNCLLLLGDPPARTQSDHPSHTVVIN